MEISLIYEEFYEASSRWLHVILQVTSKEAIVLSILEWTKLGLDRWMIFPKSPGWGVTGTRGGNLDAPWLGLWLSVRLSRSGVVAATSSLLLFLPAHRLLASASPESVNSHTRRVEGCLRQEPVLQIPALLSFFLVHHPSFSSNPCPLNNS